MQEKLMPFMLESSGIEINPETGEYQRVAKDELTQLIEDRALQAARGELELSPLAVQQFDEQEAQIRENLSRRLGPNWEQTTPGIQAMKSFRERRGLLEEEMRRGEISASTGLLGQREGLTSGLGGQNISNMQGAYGGYGATAGQYSRLLQPYQYQRGLQFQANKQTAQNNAQREAGMMQAGGMGIGLAMGGLF